MSNSHRGMDLKYIMLIWVTYRTRIISLLVPIFLYFFFHITFYWTFKIFYLLVCSSVAQCPAPFSISSVRGIMHTYIQEGPLISRPLKFSRITK